MENIIDIKVGDVVRMNKSRKTETVIHEFSHDGKDYLVIEEPINDRKELRVANKKYYLGVHVYYGNVWSGIVEVNGKKVRGTGGKLLDEPKEVVKKTKKVSKKVVEMKTPIIPTTTPTDTNEVSKTDFVRFLGVQQSGVINMTDIVNGARLAHISEEKYEDIIWNYDKYMNMYIKNGK